MTPFTAALALALLGAPPTAQAAGDRDTWQAAKAAAARYHVSPVLLVSIRVHENPKRCNDYKACGVKRAGGWAPGGLCGQMLACARTLLHYARSHGWNAQAPTKRQVSHLGRHYAEGSTEWGVDVWALYGRMHTKRAEVAR